MVRSGFPALPVRVLPFIFICRHPLNKGRLSCTLRRVIKQNCKQESTDKTAYMCRIVHPFACKTKIKRKSSHDHYLSGRKIFNMTSAPDHSIDHCTHHSKHCTGCTCRNCKIRTVQFQEQTQQISTHSSQKIDQQIFQFFHRSCRFWTGERPSAGRTPVG